MRRGNHLLRVLPAMLLAIAACAQLDRRRAVCQTWARFTVVNVTGVFRHSTTRMNRRARLEVASTARRQQQLHRSSTRGVLADAEARHAASAPTSYARGEMRNRSSTATAKNKFGDRQGTNWLGNGNLSSFKVLPGDLTVDYSALVSRWAMATNGKVTTPTVKVAATHQYGAGEACGSKMRLPSTYESRRRRDCRYHLGSCQSEPQAPNKRTFATGLVAHHLSSKNQSLAEPAAARWSSTTEAHRSWASSSRSVKRQRLASACCKAAPDDPDHATPSSSLMVVTGTDQVWLLRHRHHCLSPSRSACQTPDTLAAPTVRVTPEPLEPCLAPAPDGGSAPIAETNAAEGVCRISGKRVQQDGRNECLRYNPGHLRLDVRLQLQRTPMACTQGDLHLHPHWLRSRVHLDQRRWSSPRGAIGESGCASCYD